MCVSSSLLSPLWSSSSLLYTSLSPFSPHSTSFTSLSVSLSCPSAITSPSILPLTFPHPSLSLLASLSLPSHTLLSLPTSLLSIPLRPSQLYFFPSLHPYSILFRFFLTPFLLLTHIQYSSPSILNTSRYISIS